MPRNIPTAILVTVMPTMATISPVTSTGNRKRSRRSRRGKAASKAPARKVMPNSRDRPPVLAARMEAER